MPERILQNPLRQTFTDEQEEVFKESVATYGEVNQLEQTCEELSEALLAISKYKRAIRTGGDVEGRRAEMEREFADVIIMMTQMKLIFNNTRIQGTIYEKLERQRERLDARNQNL